MRFKITLKTLSHQPEIPINYQYELSAWIYRLLQKADAEYSSFLHDKGYASKKGKSFKLFCFSNLYIPKRYVEKGSDRLKILCPQLSLQIAFYIDKAAESFIRGLFQDQIFTLGDRYSQAELQVMQVELLSLEIPENGAVTLSPLSPIVVAERDARGQDQYLSPLHPNFGERLLDNLISKYTAALQEQAILSPVVAMESTPQVIVPPNQQPKARLITLKTDTTAQTKVKGYTQFRFQLIAPPPLIEIGLLAGLGKENAQGFGMVEIVRD